MSLFRKHKARLSKKAEDSSMPFEKDEDKKEDETKEATFMPVAEDDNSDDMTVEAEDSPFDTAPAAMDSPSDDTSSDPDLQAIGDAVESYVEEVIQDVASDLVDTEARPEVAAAVITLLKRSGIKVNNPYAPKFSKAELTYINQTVKAAVEAVEEVLERSARAINKAKKDKKQAKKCAEQLDQRLAKNGYLSSRVANPVPQAGTRQAAMDAAKKTRKNNVLGLE